MNCPHSPQILARAEKKHHQHYHHRMHWTKAVCSNVEPDVFSKVILFFSLLHAEFACHFKLVQTLPHFLCHPNSLWDFNRLYLCFLGFFSLFFLPSCVCSQETHPKQGEILCAQSFCCLWMCQLSPAAWLHGSDLSHRKDYYYRKLSTHGRKWTW